MRIVFLHSELNARGGVSNVNVKLMEGFLKQGHEVIFIAMRMRHNSETVVYPKAVKVYLLNETDEWRVPLYSIAYSQLKKGAFVQAGKQIYARKKYDRQLKQDYLKCQRLIEDLQPNVIICTHYECLQGISDPYLSRTIHEYHNDYSQIKSHATQEKLLLKYTNRVGQFIWLSKGIMEEALQAGLTPSDYIYNPLSFISEQTADVTHSKNIVFVGRFVPEKRVDLLIELFLKANQRLNQEYELNIYGIGEMDERTQTLIQQNQHVHFMGSTNQPKKVFLDSALLLMTSTFEGLPLTVLEAAECGVPTIAMNFGATAKELILHQQTGILIDLDENEAFVDAMCTLLSNPDQFKQMSDAVKKHAAQFHLDAILAKWDDLLRRCAK